MRLFVAQRLVCFANLVSKKKLIKKKATLMDKKRAFAVCVTVPTANRRCSAANGSHHPNHVHKRAGSTPPPHTHCPRSGMRVYRFGTHIIPMPRRGQKWTQNRPPREQFKHYAEPACGYMVSVHISASGHATTTHGPRSVYKHPRVFPGPNKCTQSSATSQNLRNRET